MGWNEVEHTAGNIEKVAYTKFSEGNTLIRVLDSEPYSFWSHWMTKHNKGANCLGKDCPICNIVALQKANKETPTYTSSQRHAIKIWNYTTNQMEIMIQGRTFFGQLLTLHKDVGDIQSYDIKIVRKGTDTSTTYMLLPMKVAPFEHTDKIEEVNYSELFKPIEKEKLLLLMEGKSWDEVFGNSEE